jgi:rare lipoprotein A
MRTSRRVYVAAVAVMLAIPATAVALTAGPSPGAITAEGKTDPLSAIKTKPVRRHIGYAKTVTVKGNASPAQPGQRLELRSSTLGSRRWRTVAATTERSDGSFRVTTTMRSSARLRVNGAPSSRSAPLRITVAARLQLRTRSIDVLAGHPSAVHGKLLPAVPGRRVRLEGRESGGRWHLLSSTRTGSRGGFGLSYAGGNAFTSRLRVHFAGDRRNTSAAEPAGPLTVFEPAVASWYYDDTGATACGFQARYGVANRTLPCGTKVRFRNGSREVTAVVDDRGPFVAGRTWDLGLNTRDALGFVGVGSVWANK